MKIKMESYGTEVSVTIEDGSDIYEVAEVLRGMLMTVGYQYGSIDQVINTTTKEDIIECNNSAGYPYLEAC